MRTLPAQYVTDINKLANKIPFAWLFEVRLDADDAIRVAKYTANVTWNGDVYYAYPIEFDVLSSSSDGEITGARVTIPNADQQLGSYLEDNEGFVDRAVVIRLVNTNDLATVVNVPEFHYEVTGATIARESVSFELGPPDVFSRQLPACRYSRESCRWTYKSRECGYIGNLPRCERTHADCVKHGDDEVANNRERLHPARFGGFPGIAVARN